MSLGDPIVIHYQPRRETYVLFRGRETFYNRDDEMLEWDTAEEAAAWCRDHLKVEPVDRTRAPNQLP